MKSLFLFLTFILTSVTLSLIPITRAFAQAPCPQPFMSQDWIRCHNEWVHNRSIQDATAGVVRVMHVADGDTIRLESGHYVRLIGVNTPETVNPSRRIECFGPQSSEFTRTAVLGRMVRLVPDPNGVTVDRYRGLLAYVLLEDGTNLNAAIVRLGMGRVETRFPFALMHQFLELQYLAQNERRGLWGVCY